MEICFSALRIFVCILVTVPTSSSIFLNFEPERPEPIYEDDSLNIQISLNETETLDYNGTVRLRLSLRDDWIPRAVLLNHTINLTLDEPVQNFTVSGLFLGFAWVEVDYCTAEICLDEDYSSTNQTLELAILRRQRLVDDIFTILIICMVVTANLSMGCTVDMVVVKKVLKRPTAPVIGFFCQFCIMPPLSFMLTRVFKLSIAEQIGMLALGCSPGGGASNMWTLLLSGDVSLSITMTLISTVASLAFFPLWMFTLGKIVMDEAQFTIPFQNILGSLVGTIVPVGIGILLQRKKPGIARRIAKLTKPMLFIFLLFIFTFGTWVNWFMFRLFHLMLIIASCLLPYIGFLSGAIIAWILRQPREHIIAICIETGIQNTGVAIFALRLSLPQPFNDLSMIGAVCPSTFTSTPLLIAFTVMTIYKRCFAKKPEEEDKECYGNEVDINNLNSGRCSVSSITEEEHI